MRSLRSSAVRRRAEASEVSRQGRRRVSSKGIVGLQVMRAEVAVTQSGPVGQGEPEGRLSPRFRRRVSRMWAMEPAPRGQFRVSLDSGGEFLRPVVVEEGEEPGGVRA